MLALLLLACPHAAPAVAVAPAPAAVPIPSDYTRVLLGGGPVAVDPAAAPILGRWTGTDGQGITGAFEFHDDGSAVVVAGDDVARSDGRVSVGFELVVDVDPWWLDIVLHERLSGMEVGRMRFVAALTPGGELRVRAGDDVEVRPDGFVGATDDDVLTLRRE